MMLKVCLIERLKREWSSSSHCLGLNFKHGLTDVSLAPLDCCMGDGSQLEDLTPGNIGQPVLSKCELSQRVYSLKDFFRSIGPNRQLCLKKSFDLSLSASNAQWIATQRNRLLAPLNEPRTFRKGALIQLSSDEDFKDVHLFLSFIWHSNYRVFVLDLESIQPNQAWSHKYWMDEIQQKQIKQTMFVIMGVDASVGWQKKSILEHMIDFCHGTGSPFWMVLRPKKKSSLTPKTLGKDDNKADLFGSEERQLDRRFAPNTDAKHSFKAQLSLREQKRKSEEMVLNQLSPGYLAKLKDMCELV